MRWSFPLAGPHMGWLGEEEISSVIPHCWSPQAVLTACLAFSNLTCIELSRHGRPSPASHSSTYHISETTTIHTSLEKRSAVSNPSLMQTLQPAVLSIMQSLQYAVLSVMESQFCSDCSPLISIDNRFQIFPLKYLIKGN